MGDVLCYSDLDPYGRETDDELVCLENDIVHMLLESYGSNCDAPTRSVGLDDALSGVSDPALKHRIETKLTDDPRIDAAEITLTDVGDESVAISLLIQANETELGITLTLNPDGSVTRTTS